MKHCTNCGHILEENASKCSNCNSYTKEGKKKNTKKIFMIILITILSIIIGIILFIALNLLVRHIKYINIAKSLYNDYLQEDFKDAKLDEYVPCKECGTSCDGTCFYDTKIKNCNNFYYKSSSDIEEPDIKITKYNDDIKVDVHEYIINTKYGYEVTDTTPSDMGKYSQFQDNYFKIYNDDFNENDISKIYNMVNDLNIAYKKYRKNVEYPYVISISKNYKEQLEIRIKNESSNTTKISWKFCDITTKINPSLEEVKEGYRNHQLYGTC